MTRVKWSELPEKYKKDKEVQKKLAKYRSKYVEIDGYKFASKKEAKRYVELTLLQRKGDVVFFIRQPMLDLGAGVVYKADFLIFWKDGHYSIEDVKGFPTPVFKLKKKLIEANYPFSIEIL